MNLCQKALEHVLRRLELGFVYSDYRTLGYGFLAGLLVHFLDADQDEADLTVHVVVRVGAGRL